MVNSLNRTPFFTIFFHSNDPNQPHKQYDTKGQTCMSIKEDFGFQKTIHKQLCNIILILYYDSNMTLFFEDMSIMAYLTCVYIRNVFRIRQN